MSCVALFAYIDPASGTILLQLIVAGLLGSAAFFRTSIARWLGLLAGRKSAGEPAASGAPIPDDQDHDEGLHERRRAA